jgi:thioredoxin 1
MSENLIVNLSDEEFDRLTFDSSIPSMVMFGAERCNVCKELYPTVEEIAEEYAEKMKVFWVDVDQYKLLFKRFRLRGIPNLMIFNKGEIKDRMGGLLSKEELIEIINRALEIG